LFPSYEEDNAYAMAFCHAGLGIRDDGCVEFAGFGSSFAVAWRLRLSQDRLFAYLITDLLCARQTSKNMTLEGQEHLRDDASSASPLVTVQVNGDVLELYVQSRR
jgi:hypothetical protein